MNRKRTDNVAFEKNGESNNVVDLLNKIKRTKSISAEKKSQNKRISENSGIEDQEFCDDDVLGSVHEGEKQD